MRWPVTRRQKFFLARKHAAPTILSYSWKESLKHHAARAKSAREGTTRRPSRTIQPPGFSRVAAASAAAGPAAAAGLAAVAAPGVGRRTGGVALRWRRRAWGTPTPPRFPS